MLIGVVLGVAWPAGPGVEVGSRVFWIHQAVSAVLSLLFLRWVAVLARGRRAHNVIRFPGRRSTIVRG